MDEAGDTTRSRSSRELWDRLVRRAVGPPRTDEDDDEYMDLVVELNGRGEPEPVEWALDVLSSPEPALRQLGARVLADHGFEDDFPYRASTAGRLAQAARDEPDDDARVTAIAALARTGPAAEATEVLDHADDPSASVRRIVAAELLAVFDYQRPSARAVDVLLGLTTDEDSDVRDWATFALGSQTTVDDPAVRQALRARLADDGNGNADAAVTIQGEALVGLAARCDPVALDRLQRRMSEPLDAVEEFLLSTAEASHEARFRTALLAFRHGLAKDGDVARRIEALLDALGETSPADGS